VSTSRGREKEEGREGRARDRPIDYRIGWGVMGEQAVPSPLLPSPLL